MRRATLLSMVCLSVQNCKEFIITRIVRVSENVNEHKIRVLSCSENLSMECLILKNNSQK